MEAPFDVHCTSYLASSVRQYTNVYEYPGMEGFTDIKTVLSKIKADKFTTHFIFLLLVNVCFPKEEIFLTIFDGLYFSHHYTYYILQITIIG